MPNIGSRVCAVIAVALLFLGISVIHRVPLAGHVPSHQVATTVRNPASHDHHTTEKLEESLWAPARWEPITTLTVFLALFTAVLAAVSIFQAGYILRADSTARISAEAAKRAAEAAAIQARIAEQTISILEQPYIFPIPEHNFVELFDRAGMTPLEIESGIVFDRLPEVIFTLENYGRTPAILRFVNAKIDRGVTAPSRATAYPFRDIPSEHVLRPGNRTSSITVGMSAFRTMTTREDYKKFIRGGDFLWFFGFVVFDDLWNERTDLHFCWRYDHALRIFEPYPQDRNKAERRSRPHGALSSI